MNQFIDEVKHLLHPYLDQVDIVEQPPNPGMGDLAVPCFPFSKLKKKAPTAIASEAVTQLHQTSALPSCFAKVEANGGYINFFIKTSELAQAILPLVWKKDHLYGKGLAKKERVMVEYSSPNTHKAFHIGHLRNAALGSALVNILRFAGYPTITANYINDTGTHVATCVWAYLSSFKGKEPKQRKGEWLGEVYADAVTKLELDPALKEHVYDIHRRIESNDPELIKEWETTRQWSLDEFHRIYQELGIAFDQWYYDHELFAPGKAIVTELLEKGVGVLSEGAVIVDLKEYGLDVALILKGDGSALYITKDLALAKEKFTHYKIDKSVYVVASEQGLHFRQLFKILEIWGFPQSQQCHHLSYELVMLSEGKMSSRHGTIVLYRELAEAARAQAYTEVQTRHPEWTEEVIQQAAGQVAMAALKFSMISQDANKVIIFDLKKALDFYGETGPYCQYAHARACSVISKSDIKVSHTVSFAMFKTPEEHALIKLLSAFPELVQNAAIQYRPLTISRYCLDLAQAFNLFYEQCPVLKTDPATKKARLFLLHCTRVTLKNALDLLGIESPEKM